MSLKKDNDIHGRLSTMQIYNGKCLTGDNLTPVVGRLVFENFVRRYHRKEALLTVIRSGAPMDIGENTVGVIRIDDRPELIYPHTELKCPEVSLKALPLECDGKIALLDPSDGRLYVSPDIFTVNKYVKSFGISSHISALQSGNLIRLLPLYTHASDIPRDTEELLLDHAPHRGYDGEELLYEFYRDVAEAATGVPITLIVDVDRPLYNRIKAVYRSAVYGRFSLLFRSILTDKDLNVTLSEVHSAFCDLEAEGREFNGYISRGVCVDSPFLLSRPLACDGMDFCVIDAERLQRLMTNGAAEISEDVQQEIARMMVEFKKILPKIELSVILGERTVAQPIFDTLTSGGIYKFFVPYYKLTYAAETIRKLDLHFS